MNIIIQRGKGVQLEKNSAVPPLGVEYETLKRRLREKAENNLTVKDMRDFPSKKKNNQTMVLSPGMYIEYETNMFAPYPQSDIPHVDGTSWIGG